jgi:hypothetical protein
MTSEKLTLETRDPIPNEPVFVDSSGHRRRRVRAIFYLLGIAGACYTATVGLSMLGVEISAHLPKISTNAVIAQKPATPEPATAEDDTTRPEDGGSSGAAGNTEPSRASTPQTAPLPAPQAQTPQPAAVTNAVSTAPGTTLPTNTPGTPAPAPETTQPSTPQTDPTVPDNTAAPATTMSVEEDTQTAAPPADSSSTAARND